MIKQARQFCTPVFSFSGSVTGELVPAPPLAEASPGSTVLNGGGGDAHAVEMMDDGMLPAQRSTARARERGGTEARVTDEAGGRVVYIDMDPLTSIAQSHSTPAGYVPPASFGFLHSGTTVEGIGNAVRGKQRFWYRAHKLAEASPGSNILSGGGGDAHAVEMNDEMLPAQRSIARARECGGSQAHVVDEAGGRVVYIDIDIHASQQCDQSSVAAARTKNRADVLSAVFGGLVVLSVTNLNGTSKGDYPEFVKLGLFAGCLLLFVFTFLGLVMKNMGKAAMRVAAGMSITTMTIAAVYQVSDKVYIKCIIGIIGAMGTLAMGVINWR